jgi:hypothetical protein
VRQCRERRKEGMTKEYPGNKKKPYAFPSAINS